MVPVNPKFSVHRIKQLSVAISSFKYSFAIHNQAPIIQINITSLLDRDLRSDANSLSTKDRVWQFVIGFKIWDQSQHILQWPSINSTYRNSTEHLALDYV